MIKKQCFKCGSEKPLSEFYAHKQMPDGTVNKCKQCNKRDVRENYKKRASYYREYDIARYRSNTERLMKHKYRQMVQRATGTGNHWSSAEGHPYLTYRSFCIWWKRNHHEFERLYEVWEQSGFPKRLAPSIDRISNKKGYMPSNMQWLTHSDNCKKR